jgi:nucleoside-diphosphate-sugar epimerase
MILVTGATGLLGSHLLVELVSSKEKIRATYRNELKIKRVRKLFDYYFKEKSDLNFNKIEWVKSDFLVLNDLENLFQGVDYVYHCSGKVSFFKSDFHSCFRQNRDVTANIVNFCLSHNVKKLCYVSSTAALGTNPKGLTNETFKWENGKQVSGYSVSKFSAEKEVWRGIEEGLNAVIINPCVILGPGNWDDSSLTIFRTAEKGISFYPSGKNAIVDARDVAKSMHLLMDSQIHSERFLCTGVNLSFRQLFNELASLFGKKSPSIAAPYWLALITAYFMETISKILGNRKGLSVETTYSAYKNIQYDNSKLKNAIGIDFHSLKETLENSISGRTK